MSFSSSSFVLRVLRAATFLVGIAPVAASAAPPEKTPPPPKEEAPPEEETKSSLSVGAAPVLPIGDLSNGVGFGLGGLLGYDYAFHPNAAFVARTGYIHHLPKDFVNVTIGVIPIWAGARYGFLGHEGPYIEGVLGPSIFLASAEIRGYGRATDSEVRLGTALGGGYRFRKVDLGGRFTFYDLGHAGDTMGMMATASFSFASF